MRFFWVRRPFSGGEGREGAFLCTIRRGERRRAASFAPMGGCFVVPTERVEPHLKLQLPGRGGALKPHPRPGVALTDFQPKAEPRCGVAFACTIYVPAARGRRMLAVLRPASKLYAAGSLARSDSEAIA